MTPFAVSYCELNCLMACLTHEPLRALVAARPALSLLGLLESGIPPEVKLCAALHHYPIAPYVLRHFAYLCAERALPLFEESYPKDLRPRDALSVVREHLAERVKSDSVQTARLQATLAAHPTRVPRARLAAGVIANAAIPIETTSISVKTSASLAAQRSAEAAANPQEEVEQQVRDLVSLLESRLPKR